MIGAVRRTTAPINKKDVGFLSKKKGFNFLVRTRRSSFSNNQLYLKKC